MVLLIELFLGLVLGYLLVVHIVILLHPHAYHIGVLLGLLERNFLLKPSFKLLELLFLVLQEGVVEGELVEHLQALHAALPMVEQGHHPQKVEGAQILEVMKDEFTDEGEEGLLGTDIYILEELLGFGLDLLEQVNDLLEGREVQI